MPLNTRAKVYNIKEEKLEVQEITKHSSTTIELKRVFADSKLTRAMPEVRLEKIQDASSKESLENVTVKKRSKSKDLTRIPKVFLLLTKINLLFVR